MMMSSEDYVEVPPDSTGKKLRALKKNVGGNDVYDEVVAVEDGSGNVIDPRKNVEITGLVVVGASALPTGAATESTLGSVKAKTDNLDTPLSDIKSKTDNIDVALSTRALEAGGNLATLVGKDFATQTTLALIKAKTDNVDAALSTRALEAGGNLAAIAGKDFATQTTLALIKAKTDDLDTALSGIKSKTDNLDVALSTRALEAGGNLAAAKTDLDTLVTKETSIDGKITACNTGAVVVSTLPTIPQSTKHDAKTYIYAFGDIAATGLLGLAKAAGKVIKVHFYSLQSTVDGVTAYFYEETSATQLSKKWILNAREGQESPFVTAPANLPKCATQNKDMGINISGGTSPHVYWEIIYSVDDAS